MSRMSALSFKQLRVTPDGGHPTSAGENSKPQFLSKALNWQPEEKLLAWLGEVGATYMNREIGKGFFLLTNQRIVFVHRKGILKMNYRFACGINLTDIVRISCLSNSLWFHYGTSGRDDALVIHYEADAASKVETIVNQVETLVSAGRTQGDTTRPLQVDRVGKEQKPMIRKIAVRRVTRGVIEILGSVVVAFALLTLSANLNFQFTVNHEALVLFAPFMFALYGIWDIFWGLVWYTFPSRAEQKLLDSVEPVQVAHSLPSTTVTAYCPNCGGPLKKSERFCGSCGFNLSTTNIPNVASRPEVERAMAEKGGGQPNIQKQKHSRLTIRNTGIASCAVVLVIIIAGFLVYVPMSLRSVETRTNLIPYEVAQTSAVESTSISTSTETMTTYLPNAQYNNYGSFEIGGPPSGWVYGCEDFFNGFFLSHGNLTLEWSANEPVIPSVNVTQIPSADGDSVTFYFNQNGLGLPSQSGSEPFLIPRNGNYDIEFCSDYSYDITVTAYSNGTLPTTTTIYSVSTFSFVTLTTRTFTLTSTNSSTFTAVENCSYSFWDWLLARPTSCS